MKLLAISGSARRQSTNTALLKAMQALAPDGIELSVFHRLDTLPIFSPDSEGESTPVEVLRFVELIEKADGVVISSPEYVRSIPGGIKNAIEWMVSRVEIVGKPIALVHASHRGDDMLASLRLVLSTVSDGFLEQLFLRLSLLGKTPEEIELFMRHPEPASQVASFLSDFAGNIREKRAPSCRQ
jgi:hypothetical protein